ncbi:MAG: ABC transporter ATP-binding protein [Patescibacteria group bacterium]|nr:ABC transporter ATP-binding protein [Patescibacteria group bacterium]
MPLIQTKNLNKEYCTDEVKTPVLFDIDLEINSGEFVSIMGPSGSGKSTLMHILGFLDRLTSGQYLFESADVTGFDDKKLARIRNEKIGFVFQSFNLLPRTTVLENVKLPLQYRPGLKEKEKNEMAESALKAVGLEHRMNFFSNQLSGGEKQRVAIARALVTDPTLIFADEPTGNLDSKSGLQIMEILDKLNKAGKTIILVTHETNTASFAHRIIALKDGRIVSDRKVDNRNQFNGTLK